MTSKWSTFIEEKARESGLGIFVYMQTPESRREIPGFIRKAYELSQKSALIHFAIDSLLSSRNMVHKGVKPQYATASFNDLGEGLTSYSCGNCIIEF